MSNPFTEDIYPVDYIQPTLPGDVSEIHAAVAAQLAALIRGASASGMDGIDSRHGDTALLVGNRAGTGKTHLLHRLCSELEGEAVFVPVTFNLDQVISWRTILEQTLDRLAQRDASTRNLGLTFIQEIARRMFSEVTALLIEEGEIPSASPQNAISGLRRNYLRLFDNDEGDSAVRDWLTNNFDQLRPVMANVLAERRGMVESSAAFWLDILRDANERTESCADILSAACPPEGDTVSINSISKMRLANLCRLASVQRPLVFVFDHLDSFHGKPERGLEIAYLISELRLLSPGQISIVSLNRDLWDSAFGATLPDALADRLSAHPLRLHTLQQSGAEAVVKARALAYGIEAPEIDALLRRLELPPSEHLTPRVALRCAGRDWNPSGNTAAPPAKAPAPQKESLGGAGEIRPIPPKESVPLKSLLFDDITPAKAEPADDGPGKVVPSEIKKKGNILAMVERLKRRRTEAESAENTAEPKPAAINGKHGHEAARKNGSVVPIALRQRARAPLHPLVQRFRRLREELSPSDLSQESLRQLVRAVGEQSPFVEYSETKVPRHDASLARWEEPDGEVFFCFANEVDPGVWAELLEIGAEKVRLAHLDDQEKSKLVTFAKDGPPRSIAGGSDHIDFDARQSATLEAAARLLADPAVPTAEALQLLTHDLDFFWKRVTRHMEGAQAVG